MFGLLVYSQQQVIIGSVISDDGAKLPGAVIINMRTEFKAYSDTDGHFLIPALPTDELRVLRMGYDRKSITVKEEDFLKPIKVSLTHQEQLIEELNLGFVPTGNLKKDLLRLETKQDRKIAALNKDINSYMRGKPNMVMPSNRSSFAPQGIQGGLNLGSIAGLLSKPRTSSTTNPTFAESQKFYSTVMSVIDVDYFASLGIVDYDLERLVAFADGKYQLAKKYRNNFNKNAIMQSLKLAVNDFKISNEKAK